MRDLQSDDEVFQALECAAEWDLLRIPEDVEVMVTGFRMRRDVIVKRGVVVTMKVPLEEGWSVTMTDCDLESCTAAGVTDALIPLIHDALPHCE